MSEHILDTLDLAVLGQRLQQKRLAAQVTEEQAVQKLGVELETLQNIELGQMRIGAGQLLRLARLYRSHVSELIAPQPTRSVEQWIEAYLKADVTEGQLVLGLKVHVLEARKLVQAWCDEQRRKES